MTDQPPTPRTWTEDAFPTPHQLDDYLARATLDERLLLLDRLLRQAHTGHVCTAADHESYPDTLRQATAGTVAAIIEGNRYRLAWQSARRRAQHATDRARWAPHPTTTQEN